MALSEPTGARARKRRRSARTRPMELRSGAVRPRLGFLGVGWIGHHRLEAIAASNCADITALADANVDLAIHAAAGFPGAVPTNSLETLLKLDLDGVVIATPTAPAVSSVSVDRGANKPGVDKDSDGEVMLDIEVAGAVAPGARIVVYFAPNTDQGFHDAITSAVHDTVNKPSVISISWADRRLLDAAGTQRHAGGMHGRRRGRRDGDGGLGRRWRYRRRNGQKVHVDLPASCHPCWPAEARGWTAARDRSRARRSGTN